MAILGADQGGAAGILEVAEGLFQEMIAFGVLAAGREILDEQLHRYAERVGALMALLEIGEAAGLRFGDQAVPYWSNHANWEADLPVAGYAGGASAAGYAGGASAAGYAGGASAAGAVSPRPSQVLTSMMGAWRMVFDDPSHSCRWRLLRSVLWQAWHNDMWSGLQLAMDLSTTGYLLRRDDIEAVVTLVLAARDQCGSDRETVTRLLGGHVPDSPSDFSVADPTPGWVATAPLTTVEAKTLVQRLLRALSSLTRQVRAAADLDTWILGQQRLFNLAGPLLAAVRTVLPERPLALDALVSQLAEVNADAGGFAGAVKLHLGSNPSFDLLVSAALPVMFEYQRLGEGWEDRICHERVLIPDALGPVMLDIEGPWPTDLAGVAGPASPFASKQRARQEPQCPPAWKQPSPALAFPLVVVLRPESPDVTTVASGMAVPAAVEMHPGVTTVLNHHQVTDPHLRHQLVAAAVQGRPGRYLTDRDRILLTQAKAVASGQRPLASHTNLDDGPPQPVDWIPSSLDDDLVDAVAQAAADLGAEAIHKGLSAAATQLKTGDPGDVLIQILLLQTLYPWSPDIWAAISSVLFKTGDFGGSRHAMQQALVLRPAQSEPWQALAAILERMGRPTEEARLTARVASMLSAT